MLKFRVVFQTHPFDGMRSSRLLAAARRPRRIFARAVVSRDDRDL